MIIRLALVALLLLVVWLVWRNLGARARLRTEQRHAWDEPLREGSAVILSAAPAAWWWLLALAGVTAIVGRMLFERMTAGETVSGSVWHWLLFLALAAVVARRAVQLSERVTVTWERITSRNLFGRRYSLPLDEVTGVDADERTAILAFRDGRVLELSPWLEGRFWLAREMRKRLEDRRGDDAPAPG
ncbi:MAG: hypothetical protein ACQEUZ_05900 [Pseudomonadota bacterium]